MSPDLLIPAIAFLFGIVAVYLVFRQQISAIEERARNDLDRWKIECTNELRKDSVKRFIQEITGRDKPPEPRRKKNSSIQKCHKTGCTFIHS